MTLRIFLNNTNMMKSRVSTVALLAAAFLAGCGGSDSADKSPPIAFTQMINFGDSLSDVGSYDVGAVQLQGGGHFSINGQDATGLAHTNWTEFLAATLHVTQPCAAETGLETIEAVVGVAPVAAKFHDTEASPCLNYAQGGARVTADVGPGNARLFNQADPSTFSNAIGQLTVPVHKQIQRYITNVSPTFLSNQLITVFAGGNDIISNAASFQATVALGGDPTSAAAAAVAAMVTAADELADDVNTNVIARGATHVVVVNLPDISLTPGAIASGASGQALVKSMVQAFNVELATKLTHGDSLLLVDASTRSVDQTMNMAKYGLTDVTTPACTTSSSLVCTKATLISALTPTDLTQPATLANTYLYADTVHPTPYGYRLLAQLVADTMAVKGWL
jgi:phospholipase/lecithinase/hemolysin